MAAVPDAVRRSLEALIMKGYEYQSEFARKYYGQGVEAGVSKGVEVGHAEGLRDAVLELARARLADLSSDETAAVRALGDQTMLLALIRALACATTAEEAREVLRAVAAER